MISLDKNILNARSAVARRMVEYGKNDELFIIIPDKKKVVISLSATTHVYLTGGNKIQQFWRLKKIGEKLIKENSVNEITAQDPFYTGLVGFLLKKKFGIKLEVQVHGDFFDDYYKRQWLRIRLAKFVIKHANIIRVVGERIKSSLIKLGINKEQIVVRSVEIENLDLGVYLKISKENIIKNKYPNFEKYFFWGGRMEPVKNLFWLVDIFAEVVKVNPKYFLLLVGSGSQLSVLQKKVSDLNLDENIKFLPWTDSFISFLANSDCLLFPSLSEGYGLVPMEASAAGINVIMNDVGVANYELKPSKKVKIIPVSDLESWMKVIFEI